MASILGQRLALRSASAQLSTHSAWLQAATSCTGCCRPSAHAHRLDHCQLTLADAVKDIS